MTRELRDKLGIFLLQKYLEAIKQKRKAKSIRNQPAPKSQKNAVPNYFCTFFSILEVIHFLWLEWLPKISSPIIMRRKQQLSHSCIVTFGEWFGQKMHKASND